MIAMKNTFIICWLGLAAVLFAGCATAPKNTFSFPEASQAQGVVVTNMLSTDLLQPPSDLFVLGPGDQMEIEVLGDAGSHTTVEVGLDGKVYFSLLPGIDVWGLTIAQARARLEEELGKYITQSKMAISLKRVGSKYVWLLGRVSKPGIYPLSGSITLLEGLAMAGGTAKSTSSITTQDLADLRHSFVLREGRMLPVNFVRLLQEGDMSQNIYLKPDDFVFIPSSLSQEVYVLGAVASPRTVPYSDMMSVVSAIAGANGPIGNAYLSHVAIVRGSLSQPQIMEVNYYEVLHGRAQNVALEPGDIIYVPLSPYRFITDYVNLIVDTFARTWSANEGVRAVSGSAASVGINVPIGITR
ncbi:MAG: polysaccharide export protein Wza [Pedosphaera sp.]|nr:polysaccharide export protein Wza [Pedosphaera sp.]